MCNIFLNKILSTISYDSIDEYDHIVDKYADVYANTHISDTIIITVNIILLSVIMIRYVLALKSNLNDFKRKDEKRKFKIYTFIFCMIEFMIAFIIAYSFIKITGGIEKNVILNYIFAPGLGLLIAMILDYKLLIPIIKSNKIETILKNRKNNTKKEDEKGTNININIDSHNKKTEEENEVPIHSNKVDHITEDDVNSDNFDSIVQESINILIDNQAIHYKVLEEQSKVLEEQSKVLDAMRETMMLERRLELKKLIYGCLSKGFATPEEDETIRTKYHSYRKLHGNHDIQELYELRYINKVPIRNA